MIKVFMFLFLNEVSTEKFLELQMCFWEMFLMKKFEQLGSKELSLNFVQIKVGKQ